MYDSMALRASSRSRLSRSLSARSPNRLLDALIASSVRGCGRPNVSHVTLSVTLWYFLYVFVWGALPSDEVAAAAAAVVVDAAGVVVVVVLLASSASSSDACCSTAASPPSVDPDPSSDEDGSADGDGSAVVVVVVVELSAVEEDAVAFVDDPFTGVGEGVTMTVTSSTSDESAFSTATVPLRVSVNCTLTLIGRPLVAFGYLIIASATPPIVTLARGPGARGKVA
mmetsp:Transcript_19554/g.32064  ORF Transcript_19554/g.32064 Transcript_19554/m.32064 type:complete len:226 (+) Transcript_19554:1710-2387(+)